MVSFTVRLTFRSEDREEIAQILRELTRLTRHLRIAARRRKLRERARRREAADFPGRRRGLRSTRLRPFGF